MYIFGGIIMAAYIIIAYRFIPESPRWLLTKQRGQEAVNWLKKMEIAVKGKAGITMLIVLSYLLPPLKEMRALRKYSLKISQDCLNHLGRSI
jgi:hypothetical protein